jgi:hypothetical protein
MVLREDNPSATIADGDLISFADVNDSNNDKNTTATLFGAYTDARTGTLTNKSFALGSNTFSGTKAQLESAISDVSDFAEADGDTYTGVHDFGGATSLEIPNGAAPTVDAAGEIAVDTTITDYTGLVKYHDGTEELTVVGMPTANLTTNDGDVVKYNAANNEFEMGAGGGSGIWELVGEDTQTNATSASVSSIGAFDALMIEVSMKDAGSAYMSIRFNSDSGANYDFQIERDGTVGNFATGTDVRFDTGSATGREWWSRIFVSEAGLPTDSDPWFTFTGGRSNPNSHKGAGVYHGASAITSVQLRDTSGGSMDELKIKVYKRTS